MNNEEFEKYDDELNAILRDFHNALFKIIRISEELDPKNYHISWVKQQIDIFRKIDKENIIKRVKDKFWFYREEIMKQDLSFFKANQFNKFIKDDENKMFMYSFVNMLKKKVELLSPQEMNEIWALIKKILACCIRYKNLIKDYDE